MHHGSNFNGDPYNNSGMNPMGMPNMNPFFGLALNQQPQHPHHHHQQQHVMGAHPFHHAMSPFGAPFASPFGDMFSGMNQMMNQMQQQMQQMQQHSLQQQMHGMQQQPTGGGQFFSSSSFYSYDGSGGEPQVYEAHSSTRQGPGGVRETRKMMKDSRSGEEKLSIGQHIHDRAHIREKRRNQRTDETEEQEDLIGMDHAELPQFRRQWEDQGLAYHHPAHHPALTNPHQRALMDGRR